MLYVFQPPTRLEDKNEIMRNNNISNIHKS